MSNNITSTLNFLKNQSLSVLIKNVPIKFPQIKKTISSYIGDNGSNFISLIGLLNFDKNVLASSTVSAVLLLAYLDFYAIYTILYSNLSSFENLKSVSKGKYSYIYNLYKNLTGIIKNKELLQSYSYSIFVDFLDPQHLNDGMSGLISRDNRTSGKLSTKNMLTLPLKQSKEIKPAHITFTEKDGSYSETDSLISGNNLTYNLTRYQNNKIGIAEKGEATPMGSNVKYGISPEIEGTIFGYFADFIFITVSKIETNDDDTINNIYITASTNGYDWADDLLVKPGEKTKILVEDNIEIGLSIILYDGYGLAEGDQFIIKIQNGTLESPKIDITFGFDILEQISYLKYLDLSEHKLIPGKSFIDRDKFGDSIREAKVYDSRIGQIIMSEGTIDEYKTSFTQDDFDITSLGGKLSYKYNFNIAEITGFINEYATHGSIVFNPLEVQNINTVTINAEDHITNYGEHTEEIPAPLKSIVEYNILAENETGRILIPMLKQDEFSSNPNLYNWDFIIPATINEDPQATQYYGTAYYTPRFPVNTLSPLKIYNPSTGQEETNIEYKEPENIFLIMDYLYSSSQVAWYPVKTNKVEDITEIVLSNKWIKGTNTIYYMYYIDENEGVHLAIREYDTNTKTLKPFSGKIYGQIEMRSLDQAYITPAVFNYSVSCV